MKIIGFYEGVHHEVWMLKLPKRSLCSVCPVQEVSLAVEGWNLPVLEKETGAIGLFVA